MLEVNAPVGNIFRDEGFDELKEGNFERLKISRMESRKKNFEENWGSWNRHWFKVRTRR